MLEVREEDIDRITAMFYRVLKGELPPSLDLPKDYPENEVRQVVEYANRFVAEYQALALRDVRPVARRPRPQCPRRQDACPSII